MLEDSTTPLYRFHLIEKLRLSGRLTNCGTFQVYPVRVKWYVELPVQVMAWGTALPTCH